MNIKEIARLAADSADVANRQLIEPPNHTIADAVARSVINALRRQCDQMVYISEFYERTEAIMLEEFMVGALSDALPPSPPSSQQEKDQKKDAGAELIHQTIPKSAEIEPRPSSDREQLKNLLRSNGWQPIIVSAAPGESVVAAAAWLYEPSCGVRLGSFGRFSDGVAFGSVSGMKGCFVRDWGATYWMPAILPEPPEAK